MRTKSSIPIRKSLKQKTNIKINILVNKISLIYFTTFTIVHVKHTLSHKFVLSEYQKVA